MASLYPLIDHFLLVFEQNEGCLTQFDMKEIYRYYELPITDFELALYVVRKNGMALQYLTTPLQRDSLIIGTAILNNQLAWKYVPEDIRKKYNDSPITYLLQKRKHHE